MNKHYELERKNINKFVLLYGFVKKDNKLPVQELDRALKYKTDYESRCKDE